MDAWSALAESCAAGAHTSITCPHIGWLLVRAHARLPRQALKRIRRLRAVLLIGALVALAVFASAGGISIESVCTSPSAIAAVVALGLRFALAHVTQMFFRATKSPGSGWWGVKSAEAMQ